MPGKVSLILRLLKGRLGASFGRLRRNQRGFGPFALRKAAKIKDAGGLSVRVPELDAARLTGHKIKTMSYGVYSGGPDLARLAAVVERIEYKELSL